DGDCWHTPIHCLLPGVKRAYYLSTGLLTLSDIAVTDLRSFSKISLINALNDLGDLEVPVSSLQF
ncbi:MAG: hypothetical protein OEY56_12155, partial [Cyclobacteriaceae bacterium]|nr:hypothetical protein [Cyclobacteriaceae bacterium]